MFKAEDNTRVEAIDLNSHIDGGSYKSLYMHQMVSNGSSKSKRSSSPAQDDHGKLPGSGGRQDEAEDDDSDVDSESEYASSDVDADDESERDDQQEEIWQTIPSEVIPDHASPGETKKSSAK